MALRILNKKRDGKLEFRESASVNNADKLHLDLLDLIAANDRAFSFEINDFSPDLSVIQLLISFKEAARLKDKKVSITIPADTEAHSTLTNTGVLQSLTD